MRSTKYLYALLALFPLSVLFSCDPGMVYHQFRDVEDERWAWEDAKKFPVEISDTTHMHNIYLQIRHTVDYPLRNLYMFVQVEGPSGQRLTDTVNMIIAEPDGTWKGKGVGKLKELQILYRKGTIFRDTGRYTFTLEQGMRTPALPVTNVGLRIERINP
ncbi:MAG: gliding motility lipoprotein GldH [Bacteroidales bacterium]